MIVAPARLYASFARYMESDGWMIPIAAKTQNPAVNQSSARIQKGASTR